MLRIYIVDDEPMAIRYLQMLLSRTVNQPEICGTETNSARAYYDILKKKPDLVFTDISMPVMDGLALAEKVLTQTEAKVYLLTSYEDFEYAKKGVKLGVSEYLLKNELSVQQLEKLLSDAQAQLDEQGRAQHMILGHNIREFLLGSTQVQEDHIYEERALQRYALLTFYKPPRFWMTPEQTAEENLNLDSYELEHLHAPEGMKCAAFAQIRNREYCAVVFFDQSVVDGQRRLFQIADGILSRICETDSDWKCICSNICLRFFDLQKEYRLLEKGTGYLYAAAKQSLFDINEIPQPRSDEAACEELLEQLHQLLTQRQGVRAIQESQAFFRFCREHDTQAGYTAHMRMFYQMLRRCTLHDGRGLEHLAISPCYASTTDLERALLNCVELYFQERERSADVQYSEHVLRAMQYIRKEYIRDISVAQIAQAAAVSEGHLRRLFKQELGMSVIDYLTEYRVQRAKVLLRDHTKNASVIWQETGFSSPQYFSYVFKRKEGVSPREYQKAADRHETRETMDEGALLYTRP